MMGDAKALPVPEFTTKSKEVKVYGEPMQAKDPQELIDLSRGKIDVTQAARATARQWYQGALELETRLRGYGPMFANDPAIQFPLQSARRHLGDFETPLAWYREFAQLQPEGPWRSPPSRNFGWRSAVGNPPSPLPIAEPSIHGRYWMASSMNRSGMASLRCRPKMLTASRSRTKRVKNYAYSKTQPAIRTRSTPPR